MPRSRKNPIPEGAVGSICSRCKEYREPTDYFWSEKGVRHGWCAPCLYTYNAERYQSKPARIGACVHCGKGYETKSARRKYCSRTCLDAANHIRTYAPVLAAKTGKTCECGADISHMRSNAKWCSDACANNLRPNRRQIVRRCRLKTQYGMTPDGFEAMFADQQRCCAICRSAEPKGSNWAVDHDHVTGQVRGILCSRCNTGIGQLQDDPEIIRAALDYVAKHRQVI